MEVSSLYKTIAITLSAFSKAIHRTRKRLNDKSPMLSALNVHALDTAVGSAGIVQDLLEGPKNEDTTRKAMFVLDELRCFIEDNRERIHIVAPYPNGRGHWPPSKEQKLLLDKLLANAIAVGRDGMRLVKWFDAT